MAEPPTKISGSGGAWTPLSVEELQAVLPAYEVIEMLGAGGMGAVYKARQRSLKRLVAIKILPLGMTDDGFKFVERFRNEAETLAQMNHPAIVNVYDFGETPTSTGSGQADVLLYFVMEFVDGTDLHKLIESSGKLTADHAMSITAHVCDALSYAHRQGVVHRDIKPANILINREGHVKVADFGLAKMHGPAQTSGLTRTNMTMGTPDYAAPEVFKPGVETDHRVDLYAVGVMLYQMLTGDVPRGFFKLPSQVSPGADPRFDVIVVKAMEANRDDRYQSAIEVRQALDEIRTTPLARDSGAGAISARSLPPRTVAKPAPPSEQKASSPGPMKWMIAAAVVMVCAIAGWFAMNNGERKPAAANADAKVSASTPQKAGAEARTIDLLPLVEVKRDAITGEWSRSARGLSVARPGGASTLQLPYRPPEEYDFEIEFTADDAGMNVNQYLSAGGRSFAWKLNAHAQTPPLYGFELLDGKFCRQLAEAATKIATAIEPGRRYRSTVEVRRGKLRALLDGQELVNWSGDFGRFSMENITRLPDDEHLGIGSWMRAVTFHKVTVREITGTGKVDVPAVQKVEIAELPSQAGAAGSSQPTEFRDVAARPPTATPWTDWLGPKLAVGSFATGQCKREADGISTDQGLAGFAVLPTATRNGAVRVTFAMRDSEGVFIDCRETREGSGRHLYSTQYTGSNLYIAHVPPDVSSTRRLINEPVSKELRARDEHTLEFRFVGDELTAILDDSHRISTRHSQLTEGICAVVLTKGVLVKTIETQRLDLPR